MIKIETNHFSGATCCTTAFNSTSRTITNFQISGLDSSMFTVPATSGPVTEFTSTDRNTGVGTYKYTVTATHTSGKTAKHDPRIENGGGLTS